MSEPLIESSGPVVPQEPSTRRGIVRAAGVIGLGNIASRVLGLVRQSVIAAYFGTSPMAGAYVIASQVPTIIYDLLIGGMLSSALVPVFSDYAERDEDQGALWRLASTVLTAGALLLSLIAIVVFAAAPLIARVMARGFSPELQAATAFLIRVITPSILFFGLSGIFTGLLYALKRFTFAAFAAAIYNLGVITGAVLLSRAFEGEAQIIGLALGIFLGSVLQLALLLPDLRDSGLHLRLAAIWREPGVRRILRLYAPIALSVIVASVGVVIDRRLASSTIAGPQTVTWMAFATTLIQFPLGLVSAAIALAVLPDLSRFAAQSDWERYRRTLQVGLRMVLVLIVPATVGLFVLAIPIVRLLFERGIFTPTDTVWTAHALRLYLLGLSFAAVDQILIIAFYSRQDTLTPALVGIGAIGVYLLIAVPFLERYQMSALVVANAAQHTAHALVMLVLLQRRLGGLTGSGMRHALPRIVFAAAAMGGVVWLARNALDPLDPTFAADLLRVALPALAGLASYALFVTLLRIEEATALVRIIGRRIAPGRFGG